MAPVGFRVVGGPETAFGEMMWLDVSGVRIAREMSSKPTSEVFNWCEAD
jgi:hypothetical protein